MPLRPALALVVLLALAGCLGFGEGDGGPGNDPATPTGTPTVDPDVIPGGNGTVPLTVPQWQVGQSWEWSISAEVLRVDLSIATTVIAADGTTYDLGVGEDLELMAGLYPFHLIGIGKVDATTLAWQAHGSPVQLLRFPLKDGDQFTTDLWGAPGAQVVVEAFAVTGLAGLESGFRSTASYATGGVFLQADYAPSLGQFVRVASYFGAETPFAEVKLVGLADAPAETHAFRVTDLGRIVVSASDPTSLAPVQGTIPGGAELVLLACFMGGAQGPATAGLVGPGSQALCAYEPNLGVLPPYNWALSDVNVAGPFVLSAQVPAGSGIFEAFAIDTTP